MSSQQRQHLTSYVWQKGGGRSRSGAVMVTMETKVLSSCRQLIFLMLLEELRFYPPKNRKIKGDGIPGMFRGVDFLQIPYGGERRRRKRERQVWR